MNHQRIAADRQPRANTDRWKRLGWWLAAGLPLLAGLLIILSENLHLPDLSEGYDVSSTGLLLSGGLLVAVGLVMTIVAVGRGRRAWKEAQEGTIHNSRAVQLSQAYEIRLRSAWMIIVGIGTSALGGCILWLAIGEH